MAANLYGTPSDALFPKTRELNFFQEGVRWTYTTNLKDSVPRFFVVAQKVIKLALVFFASAILLLSIVGSPVVLYGYKEYVIQREKSVFDQQIASLHEAEKTQKRARFVEGRLMPLTHVPFFIDDETIESMARHLKIEGREELTHEDPAIRLKAKQALVHKAALKYDNFFTFFRLKISPIEPGSTAVEQIPPLELDARFPSLPNRKAAKMGMMDRLVEWVDTSLTRGILQKTAVKCLVIFTSIATCLTIVGIPFFVLFFDKLMQRPEKLFYDRAYTLNVQSASQEAHNRFKDGRKAPLSTARTVVLTEAIRDQIFQDYPGLNRDLYPQDRDILQIPALQREDYLKQYGLGITSLVLTRP